MRILEQALDVWRDLDSRSRLWAGYALIAALVCVLGWSALAAKTAELERRRHAREMVLKELLPLRAAYQAARQSADMMRGRLASVRPDDSPAKLIEEIGIRGKGIKIAPAKGEQRGTMVEDAADVRIDGLTVNEALNLVYRLEKGSRPVVLKKANLRTRFDDPSRCDLGVTIALLKPAPGAAPK
ncbi:general secretion pathway protein GspM [Pelotalea chapellei]|uniref:General secretion pathway protein GspM n=1 Tax=Pelotalea chapellei TaxID=44671 RepID=A0ABS5U4Y8_9BACT|nr:general secretion pathway protein GspM [Pelotalea chapellei]MBT1070727.1 general secretion pathway protein GspM [Pelotalea chapellei]